MNRRRDGFLLENQTTLFPFLELRGQLFSLGCELRQLIVCGLLGSEFPSGHTQFFSVQVVSHKLSSFKLDFF